MPRLPLVAFLVSGIIQIVSSLYYSNLIVSLNSQSQQQLLTLTRLHRQNQNLEIQWAAANRLSNISTWAAKFNLHLIDQSIDLNP